MWLDGIGLTCDCLPSIDVRDGERRKDGGDECPETAKGGEIVSMRDDEVDEI